MKKTIISIICISLMIIGMGCIDVHVEPEEIVHVEIVPKEIVPKEIVSKEIENVSFSPEMQKLLDFLEEDKTDEIPYNLDEHRSIDYFVCSGFSRTLAENASEYNITMGGISIRDHEHVAATKKYHAMNYMIIDNQFIIIEPQSDDIFYLNTISYDWGHPWRYITIHPNTEMMTNFGKYKRTIDIDIHSEYDETEICMKFPPVRY